MKKADFCAELGRVAGALGGSPWAMVESLVIQGRELGAGDLELIRTPQHEHGAGDGSGGASKFVGGGTGAMAAGS